MAANQTKGSKFEQRSVIKFCWLSDANHMKFTVMCMEKHLLILKKSLCELNMGLPSQSKTKRQSKKWKYCQVIKKVRGPSSWGKKVILTVLCDMKGPMTNNFFEKGATVNSTSS